MLLTAADMREWVGRRAMDPYGEPLGEILAVLVDIDSGAPEWLLLGNPGAEEGRLAPVTGAVPTGRQIRVVATAELLGGAPVLRVGQDLDLQTKSRAASLYGLALDHESSSTGIVSHPSANSDHPDPSAPGPGAPSELLDGLRAAHAMEQASLKLLEAMRSRARDEELVHDLVLHRRATDDHAERIRVRLDELEASRARPLDWLAKIGADLQAQRGRLRGVPEPVDLAEAIRFEEAEAEAYRGLLDLARRAGDAETAKLCEQNLADELAMAMTLRNFRLRSDPGFRTRHESPFRTPPALAEHAPES